MQVAFVGASGMHLKEVASTTELPEANMKRTIITRSARTVMLADHSKWERPSTVRFADWSDFDD